MPAINEHEELNRTRPPQLHNRVQSSAGRTTRKKHVIHEENVPIVYCCWTGTNHRSAGRAVSIVAKGGDIELLYAHAMTFVQMDVGSDSLGKIRSPTPYTGNNQIAHPLIVLDHFEGQAIDGPTDTLSRQNQGTRHSSLAVGQPLFSTETWP